MLEAVRRGLIPTAVYNLLRTKLEDFQAMEAHMQHRAISNAATELMHRFHNTCNTEPDNPQQTKACSSKACSTSPDTPKHPQGPTRAATTPVPSRREPPHPRATLHT